MRGGQCVRLRQGDYSQETVFGNDPAAVAQRWVSQGMTYLHLVDLDGPSKDVPSTAKAFAESSPQPACSASSGAVCEAKMLSRKSSDWGVDRVVVGTKAIKDPAWLERMCLCFPGKLVLGIDAKNGHVATAGWLEVSGLLGPHTWPTAKPWAARCACLYRPQPRRHAGGTEL